MPSLCRSLGTRWAPGMRATTDPFAAYTFSTPYMYTPNTHTRIRHVAVVYGKSRAVLTNGHTGHVPRAPAFFFFSRGPQLAVVK